MIISKTKAVAILLTTMLLSGCLGAYISNIVVSQFWVTLVFSGSSTPLFVYEKAINKLNANEPENAKKTLCAANRVDLEMLKTLDAEIKQAPLPEGMYLGSLLAPKIAFARATIASAEAQAQKCNKTYSW